MLKRHGQHCWWLGRVGLFGCSELVWQDRWRGDGFEGLLHHGQHCWHADADVGLFNCRELVLQDSCRDYSCVAMPEVCDWMLRCCEGANRHHPVADMGTNCSNKIIISIKSIAPRGLRDSTCTPP